MTVLVIAYGNTLRRDDGAGPLLARRLTDRPGALPADVTVRIEHQLLPELAADIAHRAVFAVLFVDAAVRPSVDLPPQVCLRELSAGSPVAPPAPSSASSVALGHRLSPESIVELAAALSGRPAPPASILTIEGVDFSVGEGLSPETEALMPEAEKMLLLWLDGMATERN